MNWLQKMYWTWYHRKHMPAITTSRIHVRCCELYLKGQKGESFLVKLNSGMTAVFCFADIKYLNGVDWNWFIYRFNRFATTTDLKTLRSWDI